MERRDSSAPPAEPAWAALKDEELLAMRICDLGVTIAGSELETRVAQLYAELGARGLALEPPCYLGDEWFSPAVVPAIATMPRACRTMSVACLSGCQLAGPNGYHWGVCAR